MVNLMRQRRITEVNHQSICNMVRKINIWDSDDNNL